jgi:hypothetical protein
MAPEDGPQLSTATLVPASPSLWERAWRVVELRFAKPVSLARRVTAGHLLTAQEIELQGTFARRSRSPSPSSLPAAVPPAAHGPPCVPPPLGDPPGVVSPPPGDLPDVVILGLGATRQPCPREADIARELCLKLEGPALRSYNQGFAADARGGGPSPNILHHTVHNGEGPYVLPVQARSGKEVNQQLHKARQGCLDEGPSEPGRTTLSRPELPVFGILAMRRRRMTNAHTVRRGGPAGVGGGANWFGPRSCSCWWPSSRRSSTVETRTRVGEGGQW